MPQATGACSEATRPSPTYWCSNGTWMPPTGSPGGCVESARPTGYDSYCSNGAWMPTTGSPGGGTVSSPAECIARECAPMVTEATRSTCEASCRARYGGEGPSGPGGTGYDRRNCWQPAMVRGVPKQVFCRSLDAECSETRDGPLIPAADLVPTGAPTSCEYWNRGGGNGGGGGNDAWVSCIKGCENMRYTCPVAYSPMPGGCDVEACKARCPGGPGPGGGTDDDICGPRPPTTFAQPVQWICNRKTRTWSWQTLDIFPEEPRPEWCFYNATRNGLSLGYSVDCPKGVNTNCYKEGHSMSNPVREPSEGLKLGTPSSCYREKTSGDRQQPQDCGPAPMFKAPLKYLYCEKGQWKWEEMPPEQEPRTGDLCQRYPWKCPIIIDDPRPFPPEPRRPGPPDRPEPPGDVSNKNWLKQELKNLRREEKMIKRKIAKYEKELVKLPKKIEATQKKIASIEKSIQVLEDSTSVSAFGEINTLERLLDEYEGRMGDLEDRLNALPDMLEDAQGRLTKVQERIPKIEAQLG